MIPKKLLSFGILAFKIEAGVFLYKKDSSNQVKDSNE
jgi:hypothetical protein